MLELIMDLELDLLCGSAPHVVAKQGDGKSRFLRVRLRQHDRFLPVPQNCTPCLRTARAGEDAKLFVGHVCGDGALLLPLAASLLAKAGEVKCEVVVTGESGERLTSPTFTLEIEASLGGSDDPTAVETGSVLESLLDKRAVYELLPTESEDGFLLTPSNGRSYLCDLTAYTPVDGVPVKFRLVPPTPATSATWCEFTVHFCLPEAGVELDFGDLPVLWGVEPRLRHTLVTVKGVYLPHADTTQLEVLQYGTEFKEYKTDEELADEAWEQRKFVNGILETSNRQLVANLASALPATVSGRTLTLRDIAHLAHTVILQCDHASDGKVAVCERNLFDMGDESGWFKVSDMTLTITPDTGAIKAVIGSGASSAFYRKLPFAPGTYTLSAQYDAGCSPVFIVRLFLSDGTVLTANEASVSGWQYNSYYKGWRAQGEKIRLVIPDTAAYAWIGVVLPASKLIGEGEKSTVSHMQVEVGELQTPFSRYREHARLDMKSGTQQLESISPNMSFMCIGDMENPLTVHYHRNLPTVINTLEARIAALES